MLMIFLTVAVLVAGGFLYVLVMVRSEGMHSFEECESAGWLVRGIYELDETVYPYTKRECVLWSGKKFEYVETTPLN